MTEGQEDSHVNVNVGGTMFTLSPSTILQYPDTMLGSMLSKRWKKADGSSQPNNSIFLDRDPVRFRYILDFYRNGKIVIPCTLTKSEMFAEAEYFALPLEKENIEYDMDSIGEIKKGFKDFESLLVDKLKASAYEGVVEPCAHELAAILIHKFQKSPPGVEHVYLTQEEVPANSFARVLFSKVIHHKNFLNCIQGIAEQGGYIVGRQGGGYSPSILYLQSQHTDA